MISYDDTYVYVGKEAFEDFYKKSMQPETYLLFLEAFINCLDL